MRGISTLIDMRVISMLINIQHILTW